VKAAIILDSLDALRVASKAIWDEEELMGLETSKDLCAVFTPSSAAAQGAYVEVDICECGARYTRLFTSNYIYFQAWLVGIFMVYTYEFFKVE